MELGLSNINESLIEKDICIICFEPISLEKKNTNITCKCNVHCHNTCLEQWFDRSPTCPICHKIIRQKYKWYHWLKYNRQTILFILYIISIYICLFIFLLHIFKFI